MNLATQSAHVIPAERFGRAMNFGGEWTQIHAIPMSPVSLGVESDSFQPGSFQTPAPFSRVSGGFLERFGSLERMEMEGTPRMLSCPQGSLLGFEPQERPLLLAGFGRQEPVALLRQVLGASLGQKRGAGVGLVGGASCFFWLPPKMASVFLLVSLLKPPKKLWRYPKNRQSLVVFFSLKGFHPVSFDPGSLELRPKSQVIGMEDPIWSR